MASAYLEPNKLVTMLLKMNQFSPTPLRFWIAFIFFQLNNMNQMIAPIVFLLASILGIASSTGPCCLINMPTKCNATAVLANDIVTMHLEGAGDCHNYRLKIVDIVHDNGSNTSCTTHADLVIKENGKPKCHIFGAFTYHDDCTMDWDDDTFPMDKINFFKIYQFKGNGINDIFVDVYMLSS